MKSLFRKFVLVLGMMCIILYASQSQAYANSLDDLSNGSSTSNGNSTTQSSSNNSSDSISDYLKTYNPVTNENMSSASAFANPLVSFIGTVTGFIIMLVSAGIFLITALDLVYIGIPPLRNKLNPQGAMQGAGGMGMGMGMGGSQPQAQARKWVSDEAVACIALAQGQGTQSGGMGMGGMGMGGMGMGGMGMGGMGANQQAQPTKSVIVEYLKKRAFFLIIFTVASILLMSSLFTGCGINLAKLISKIVEKFSNHITEVNV